MENVFTVVIVTFNRITLLQECLECVLRQTYPVSNMVIVDNASTDGTREYLKELCKSDERITVFYSSENRGGAEAFRKCLEIAYKLNGNRIILIDDAMLSDVFLDRISKAFADNPDIKAFIDGLVESAKKKGYSVTMFNRRREIPELSSSNFMQRSFGERVAMNAPIQGTAADIIKLAMIRVSRALKEQNLKSRLILQVHDELLVETAVDEIDIVKDILTKGMKEAASLRVPLEIDIKQGNNWLEAH